VWRHNLRLDSILDFGNFYAKLTSRLSISIPGKKSTPRLFVITWKKKKIRPLEHIYKGLTRKCLMWKVYSNLLPWKPWLVEFTTILYRNDLILFLTKVFSKWNVQWKTIFEYKKSEHDKIRTPLFLIKKRVKPLKSHRSTLRYLKGTYKDPFVFD
jgi:hypothetical protein